MLCRKCNATGTLLIRKEYCYCNECFIINTNHKFRACLGKNRTSRNDNKVLICVSGDPKSTVLLDLVHNGVSLNNHKKLRIVPYFLHIENDTEDGKKVSASIREQCKKYNFDIHIVNMDKHAQYDEFLASDCNSEFYTEALIPNLGSTTKDDLHKKIKQRIFVEVAKEMECKLVFTGETTTALASRLLSNIAIGRGSQVENDIGFADNRNEFVKILRPMRDITNEEVEFYVRIKQLNPSYVEVDMKNSLQSIIKNFVLDLQENTPATVSTICKTADKIGSHDNIENFKTCQICESPLDVRKPNVTALDATMFSREISFRKPGEENTIEHLTCIPDKSSMFPLIYENLCYCCSRNYAELDNCKLKHSILVPS